MQQQKILIADPDEAGTALTVFYLTQALFDTKTVSKADAVLEQCARHQPDLVLLETDFPDSEPFALCKNLLERFTVPVFLLSSRGDVSDRVRGLEMGADDYLAKPYDARELIARIRNILRRSQPQEKTQPAATLPQTGEYVEYPDLTINLTNYSIFYRGESIETPPKELELFYFLASSPNQVFSREQLLDRLWGFDYMGDTRTVDVHIKRLREKFKPTEHWAIKTVWGVGYKFESIGSREAH